MKEITNWENANEEVLTNEEQEEKEAVLIDSVDEKTDDVFAKLLAEIADEKSDANDESNDSNESNEDSDEYEDDEAEDDSDEKPDVATSDESEEKPQKGLPRGQSAALIAIGTILALLLIWLFLNALGLFRTDDYNYTGGYNTDSVVVIPSDTDKDDDTDKVITDNKGNDNNGDVNKGNDNNDDDKNSNNGNSDQMDPNGNSGDKDNSSKDDSSDKDNDSNKGDGSNKGDDSDDDDSNKGDDSGKNDNSQNGDNDSDGKNDGDDSDDKNTDVGNGDDTSDGDNDNDNTDGNGNDGNQNGNDNAASDYLILQTICGTGIRVSELRFFTVESIRSGKVVITCKSKTRTIFLLPKLKEMLLRYAKSKKITSGAIFITKSGKSIDRSNIWREMKSICSSAGVLAMKVFPHNLRHLFARSFYKVEKDLAKLADVLGHSSIETTRLYIISTGAEHRRQMENMRLII